MPLAPHFTANKGAKKQLKNQNAEFHFSSLLRGLVETGIITDSAVSSFKASSAGCSLENRTLLRHKHAD